MNWSATARIVRALSVQDVVPWACRVITPEGVRQQCARCGLIRDYYNPTPCPCEVPREQ